MKIITGLLIAAALAFASGCAKTDWIDRTLVTVDVTGTWYGRSGGAREVFLELRQEGSRVTGHVRTTASYGTFIRVSEAIDGTVAGDVFSFKDSKGVLEGELRVSGDEMIGQLSVTGSSSPTTLQRVDPSSPPASPPR